MGPLSPNRAAVDIVIVNWNSAKYLPACLASIAALTRPVADLLIVDNASTDDSRELLERTGPEVRWIRCERNLGFCAANNLGIRDTKSPYVLVLNPDTVLRPDFIEHLLPAFEDPAVGMATGKLLRFDERTIDSAGQELGRSRQPIDRGYGRVDDGRFDRDEAVFGACGAAALYRREMLESIADPGPDFFDETFFAFGEDLDLAWRAQRRGWRAAYCHSAVALHARGGSATGAPWKRRLAGMLGRAPEIRYHVAKNRYLTILRNDRLRDYVLHLPFIAARDLATLGLLALTSPSVLLRLWRNRKVFRGALERRRLDEARPRNQVR